MKIFVIGAGRMGSEVARDLANNSKVQIGIGDIDANRAAVLAAKFNANSSKIDVTNVDESAEILHSYDAVVNASWYEYNLYVMRACFKATCHYNDLGGMFHMTRKQLQLDTEAKNSGVTAIVGGGESPGITNMMVMLAAKDLARVEQVKVFAGAKEETANSREIHFPFSVSTVIDEYARNPVEFLDTKYTELKAFSGEEEVEFPDPVGKNVCHYCLHSEPATLPGSIARGVRNVEFKIGISQKMKEALEPLIRLGLTSEEKIPVNGTTISPKQFLVSYFNSKSSMGDEDPGRFVALKASVSGYLSDSKKVISTCDLIEGPREGMRNATAFLTGIAGSIFGQMLASGKVPARGVLAPEQAVDYKDFFEELKRRGVTTKEQMIST